MFQVYFSRDVRRPDFDREKAQKHTVLQVTTNERGTFFLIFERGNWRWYHANQFIYLD